METPKDEVLYTEADIIDSNKEDIVEMPRGLGKTEEIADAVVVGEEEKEVEMINLHDILVELSKDYTLDNLNYPPIKLNMLRAIGVIKNISLDNKEEIVMNDDDWKRFYNNMTSYVNYINKGLDDVKAIIKAKQAEFNMAKTKLHGQHEDVKVIEDTKDSYLLMELQV